MWVYVIVAASAIVLVVFLPRPSPDAPRLRREAAVAAWATSVGIVAPIVSCEESHVLGSDDRCVIAIGTLEGLVVLQGLRCDIDGDVAACRYEVTK
jgi:hypothetical protein